VSDFRTPAGGLCASLLLLANCAPAGAAVTAPPPLQYDWCSAVVIRPDQHWSDTKACAPLVDDDEIARGAGVVLIGDFDDAAEPRVAPAPRVCEPNPGHEANVRRMARMRSARVQAGGPPLWFVHMTRFELVPATLAAQPEFDPAFLARTDRPFSEVLDFFAKDASPACTGGCRWSDSWPWMEGKDDGRRLRDFIDAKAGAGSYRSAVYYLARAQRDSRVFGVTAVLADLRSPAYRAWRVREAKKAVLAGAYDAVDLNHKLHQYRAGADHWIGGSAAPDVSSLVKSGDTFWSARPRGYGYPEYVAGWAALARELREAGVPYNVILGAYAWTGDALDDPRSAANEAELVREVADGASSVLVDRSGGHPSEAALDSIVRRLVAHGARVWVVDQSCGQRS